MFFSGLIHDLLFIVFILLHDGKDLLILLQLCHSFSLTSPVSLLHSEFNFGIWNVSVDQRSTLLVSSVFLESYLIFLTLQLIVDFIA